VGVLAETIAVLGEAGRAPVVPDLLAGQADEYVAGWVAGWADVDAGEALVDPVGGEFVGPLGWIAGYYEALRCAHATGELELPDAGAGT
jgi:hypothetical protein